MYFFSPGSRLGAMLARYSPLRRLRAGQARILAAVLAGAAIWLVAAPAVRHLTASGTPVVVLRRAVGSSQAITAADVTTSNYPGPLVPAGALRQPADAVGRRLAAPAAQGEPLTTDRLTPSRSLAADEVAAVLPVDAATAAALHAGDPARVLVPQNGSSARSGVAVDVRVLSVYPPDSGRSLTSTTSATTPVMVAVRSQDANRFTAIHASSSPIVLIRPYS